MRTTKEADLNVALLHYVAKCLAEGDEAALTHLGLDREVASAIDALHLTDIDHLGSLHFPLLRAEALDRDLFHRLIHHLEAQRAQKSVRDALLALDAPFPLLHHYFGMDAAEYAEHGRGLGVIRPLGRPQAPSEAEETAIWQALKALEKSPEADLTAEEYLALCQQTRLSPRTVWRVIHRARALSPVTAEPCAPQMG